MTSIADLGGFRIAFSALSATVTDNAGGGLSAGQDALPCHVSQSRVSLESPWQSSMSFAVLPPFSPTTGLEKASSRHHVPYDPSRLFCIYSVGLCKIRRGLCSACLSFLARALLRN